VYVPVAQETEWGNYLVVRSTVAPAAIVTALRRELAAVDRGVPLYNVATMEETIGRSLDTRRLTNVLLTGFATTALLLAAIGMYGVMSLGVGARIREFGVRLALGAQGRDVVRLVLREGAILVALGLGIGLAGAAAVSRVLRGLLFGVQSLDVVTFAAVALVMTVAALTACYLPARRATRADPMLALRNE
jgi:putative ABC transport system permease protein